jgi:putative flippase GtrA
VTREPTARDDAGVVGVTEVLQRPMVRKLLRYSVGSVVGTVTGQGLLILFHSGFGWSGTTSNIAAVCISTIPVYLINRYWTWQKRGPNRWMTEIIPFWVMTLLGLLLSTLAVAYADARWDTQLAVTIASMSGFAVLWLAKFMILDKVLFKQDEAVPPQI